MLEQAKKNEIRDQKARVDAVGDEAMSACGSFQWCELCNGVCFE